MALSSGFHAGTLGCKHSLVGTCGVRGWMGQPWSLWDHGEVGAELRMLQWVPGLRLARVRLLLRETPS